MAINTAEPFTTDSSESPIIESIDHSNDSTHSTFTTTTSESHVTSEEDSTTTFDTLIEQKTSESTDSTTKKVDKKSADNSDYFMFGYIPNYKIPIINIPISYPVDIITDNVRYFIAKFGFNEKGIAKKSVASKLQSFIYGGNIPKNSVFSYVQSFSSKK